MKLLQEFIDNKKLYYAYEYFLNYVYTLIRMYTGYTIRSIFLLVTLALFSILIFFFYKEFYTLILKDPLLGISLILILCGYISYLQFNLGCRIIITLTKGIPHFLHISVSVIIIITGLTTLFFKKEIITELSNYPKTLNTLLIVSLFYVIFLKFNLLTRLTFVLFKGIPYLKWEINNIPRLVFYLSYNTITTIFTLLVIKRIYTTINIYNPDLCYIIFLYNCIFTTILYFTYMYFIYEGIDFKTIDNSKIKLTVFSIILLSLFPIALLFNFFEILHKLPK